MTTPDVAGCFRARYPSVLIGPGDQVTLVFQEFTSDAGRDSIEVAMLRLDPNQDDRDGGPASLAQIQVLPKILVSVADGFTSNHPSAGIDAAGNVHVTYFRNWSEFSGGTLVYRGVDPSGAPLTDPIPLSTTGPAISRGKGFTFGEVTVDAAGVPVVTWTQVLESGLPSVVFQSVRAGAPGP